MSGLRIDVEYRQASEDFGERVRHLEPELRKATAKAVNETADAVLQGLVPVIEEAFDEPTDFTLDAFAATKARPTREPSALVYMKDEQYSYLKYHIEGGARTGGGKYDHLVTGGVVVPGSGAELDEHGNFPDSYIEFAEANGGWWMTTRGGDMGLFRRDANGNVEAVAIVTDKVVYRRRLAVGESIRKIVEEVLPEKVVKGVAAMFDE